MTMTLSEALARASEIQDMLYSETLDCSEAEYQQLNPELSVIRSFIVSFVEPTARTSEVLARVRHTAPTQCVACTAPVEWGHILCDPCTQEFSRSFVWTQAVPNTLDADIIRNNDAGRCCVMVGADDLVITYDFKHEMFDDALRIVNDRHDECEQFKLAFDEAEEEARARELSARGLPAALASDVAKYSRASADRALEQYAYAVALPVHLRDADGSIITVAMKHIPSPSLVLEALTETVSYTITDGFKIERARRDVESVEDDAFIRELRAGVLATSAHPFARWLRAIEDAARFRSARHIIEAWHAGRVVIANGKILILDRNIAGVAIGRDGQNARLSSLPIVVV